MLENHCLETSKPFKIMERSLFSARNIFIENMWRSGSLTDSEFSVLDEMYKYAIGLELDVDLIIYLQTTPEKALERVNVRSRSEEDKVKLEYVAQIHKRYEEWLVHQKVPLPAPVLFVDADVDRDEMEEIYRVFQESLTNENLPDYEPGDEVA